MSPSLQIADQNHFLPTVLTENVCPKPESTTLKKKKKIKVMSANSSGKDEIK